MPTISIIEDTRNKIGSHEAKNEYWIANGIVVTRSKLAVGDYCIAPSVAVDSKASIQELAMDIDHEHERFRRELIKAKEMGIALTVLVENEDGVRDLNGLAAWEEPAASFARRRNAKRRISGMRLAKACMTMSDRYGVEWAFCAPEDAGARVVEILEGGSEDERA